MFDTYTDANKYTSSLLQIRYSVRQMNTDDLTYYEVHRYATKSYSYLALTKAAAQSCQAAKIAQYTRTAYQWSYDEEEEEFESTSTTECMADVSARPNGSGWEVDIAVSENDVVLSTVPPEDPADLFESINVSRSYDEDEGEQQITLLSARRVEDVPTNIRVVYSTQLPQSYVLSCDCSTSPTFTSFTTLILAYPTSRIYFGAPATGSIYIRLRFDTVISNIVEVSE